MRIDTVRVPDPDGPQREPDGESEDGTFYFWLGDDEDQEED